MKKIFTLVAMATMSLGAFAQAESAFLDAATLVGDATTKLTAGTELCKSTSVTMKAAYDCDYKKVAMTGESDLINAMTIDGTLYSNFAAGIQGQSNPTNTKNATTQQPVDNAIFRFDVTADGYLYVFSKLSANKQYYAFEGEYSSTTNSSQIAYTTAFGYQGDGQTYNGALAATAEGYADYTKDANYPFTTIGTYFLCDLVGMRASTDENYGKNSFIDAHKKNALGGVGFPVYKDAGTYYFFAVGSKVTCDGFLFVPGATTFGTVSFSNVTGIENVKAAKNVAEGVAYNLAGQKVGADFKGIVVKNGVKMIQK